MARAWRQEELGGIYHVAARGNNGQDIFRDDSDREEFLRRLGRCVSRYRWVCLAYCLMTNHFHLVLKNPEGGLSSGMQELISGHARQMNQRHGRRDHLFRQRFFSVQLTRESHFLEACRYVVLNPVRAGLCQSPAEWRWSSYRACAGHSFALGFLATGELLRIFDSRPGIAAARYRSFVASAHDAGSDAVIEA
ncbi:MAG TPA: transposase [Gaiellaceae bacterium]|jgi:REP element-mobilizing transposase RayT|nr:transposase [Gaiellaceae bacterium]